MLKEVTRTARIEGLIAKSFGDEQVKFDELAIFEAVAANTRPIGHKGGIFMGASLQPDLLAGMADFINVEGKHVPLQLMHRSGIPAGKVFATELRSDESGPALNALFYIPRKDDGGLIAKINTDVISQVSVGVNAQRVLCSKCGWDYLGPEATFDHIYDLTCANGHTIGVDGTHTNLFGLADWMELSLVDRGAVGGADILPRPKQTFTASVEGGFDRKGLRLFACAAITPPEKANAMSEELVKAKVDLALAEREVTSLKAANETATTELTSLRAKVVELEAKLATGEPAKVEAMKVELAASQAFLANTAKAVLLATGKATETVPEDAVGRIAIIENGRALLSAVIPAGGASQGAGAGSGTGTEAKRDLSAFTGRKG